MDFFRRHDVPLRSASGARRVAFLITCKFAAPAPGATDPSDFFLPAERYDRIFFLNSRRAQFILGPEKLRIISCQ
jgi:hypothetical protein